MATLRTGSPRFAYVGTFTTERRGARGLGLHVYRVDGASGAWTHIQQIGGLVNPSFLVPSPDQRCLYAVHGDDGHATAFALDGDTGEARVIGTASCGGMNGVRQDISADGRWMVIANYASVDNLVPGIDADCGGACACATCHVYVEGAWFAKTGPRTEMEQEMLSFAAVTQPNSRLACQVNVTPELDGLVVHMPEGQH